MKDAISNVSKGYEKLREDIVYNLISGNMIFLQIGLNEQKRKILESGITQFKNERRILYLNCAKIGQDPNIKKVFQKRYWIIGSLLNMRPKNMIILIDNIRYMSHKNCEIIKYYFDQDRIKSVLFIGEDYSTVNLSPSIKHRIGNRVFMA